MAATILATAWMGGAAPRTQQRDFARAVEESALARPQRIVRGRPLWCSGCNGRKSAMPLPSPARRVASAPCSCGS